MFRVRFLALLLMLGLLAAPVLAAQVDCDSTYCFSSGDFSSQDEPLLGICITDLPRPETGTVMLGSRVLQPGDILSAGQLQAMTFQPLRREQDTRAVIRFLPIYEDRVEQTAALEIAVLGKEDLPPEAGDLTLETYQNLPNRGQLPAQDPEGQPLTYSVLRGPRRGQLRLNTDGSFFYTPRKNKVGVDSFTFSAADPGGHVSREATVTVQIVKPADSRRYTDTVGMSCRFPAEWMRNSGLFQGEQYGQSLCFFPEKPVSRGEFLAMAVKLLDIPTEDTAAGLPAGTPLWLRPYMAAALRAGLTADLPEDPDMNAPIPCEEAAVLLQNALDLQVPPQALETAAELPELPARTAAALWALQAHDLDLQPGVPLTRGRAAEILYRAQYLAAMAPGSSVLERIR